MPGFSVLSSQMHSHLLFLFCVSLTLSTVAVVFVAVALATLPVLWIIPTATILTVVYHVLALVILHRDSRSCQGKRLFSTTSQVIAIVLTFIWLSIVGVSITLAVLGSLNRQSYDKDKRWIVVVSAVLSSLETIIIAFITASVHKERKSILYREKWEWKTNMTRSQWSVS